MTNFERLLREGATAVVTMLLQRASVLSASTRNFRAFGTTSEARYPLT